MRIAHITRTAASTGGRIAADLCRLAIREDHQVLFCYGSGPMPAGFPCLQVGDTPDVTFGMPARRSGAPVRFWRRLQCRMNHLSASAGRALHAGLSRLDDRSGFHSRAATTRLIRQLQRFAPDVIHLHDLHGDYLHLPTLFSYLQTSHIPTVWTLHDMWPFTGHCVLSRLPIEPSPAPDAPPARCLLWQKRCSSCPLQKSYPASFLRDQSTRNFTEKLDLISGLDRLVVTAPSRWMQETISHSFLSRFPVHFLPYGVDLSLYAPCANERHMQDIALFYGLDQLDGRRLVLSVAARWDERKGLADLVELARALGEDYCVAPVGLTQSQIDALPYYMLGLPYTANPSDLSVLYTAADCCISLRQGDAMDITLLEAMACGTQVLCYDAPATPELITPETGAVIPTGDISAAADAVRRLCDDPRDPLFCIARAARFGTNLRYEPFLRLYEQLVYPGA